MGAAVASEFIAVGAVVPHAKAGAVATRCYADPRLGEVVLGHLAAGADAEPALRRALEEDPGGEEGRIGVVDVKRRAASHTGARCPEYAGRWLATASRRKSWRGRQGGTAGCGGRIRRGQRGGQREGVDKGPWSSS